MEPGPVIHSGVDSNGLLRPRILLFAVMSCALASLFVALHLLNSNIPSYEAVKSGFAVSEAVLLDRFAEPIHETRVDFSKRTLSWVSLEDISPNILTAVVDAEDRRFYRHYGVDWRALYRSLWDKINGNRRGGSTIPAQVAILASLKKRPQTVLDKLRQFQLAALLERDWTKGQVLEAYLNLVPFRGELRGVRSASRALFGHEPVSVGLKESLLLAVLLRAPSAPLAQVANRLCALPEVHMGSASCKELTQMARQALTEFQPITSPAAFAPHVAQQLLPREGGVGIRSTLDGELQRYALGALREQLSQLKQSNVRDGSVLVVDNISGEVLAYVGNTGTSSSAHYVDGVRARRLAGSTLKPFLYTAAIDERLLTAASVLEDSPTEIAVHGGVYRPRNYDNSFHGPVLLGTALGSSLNVPAVRTLELVGVEEFHDVLKQLGFQGLRNWEVYGSSLALGSAEVSLWELTNAYRVLMQAGVWEPLKLVPDSKTESKKVFSSGAAFIVSELLASRENRLLTFDTSGPLSTRFWSMVKTGTSKDMTDNWCVGSTAQFTVGVWVGNFSGEPMWNVSGISGAAPVWADVVGWLSDHRGGLVKQREPDWELIKQQVSFAGSSQELFFLKGTEPSAAVAEPSRERVRGESFPSIVYPSEGLVLALDPEIPRVRQRLPLEAIHAPADSNFLLNGSVALGSARDIILWEPVPGKHLLSIVRANGDVLATTAFIVRSAGMPTESKG